jgi:hypothetical protein
MLGVVGEAEVRVTPFPPTNLRLGPQNVADHERAYADIVEQAGLAC